MKKLKPHKVDWAQIERFLASADKKLATAQKILAFDEEASLQQAYEAMLKGLPRFHVQPGFRAGVSPAITSRSSISSGRESTKKDAGLLTVFDRLRRQRNMALYDDTGFISRHDAERALKSARDYLAVIRAAIARRKP